MERHNGSLTLAVADDGVGFDAERLGTPGERGGFGLVGLRERVALLGGTLDLDTGADEGTSVCITVPLTERRATVLSSAKDERRDGDRR